MDIKLKTTITFTFESIENYEDWSNYNEGSSQDMRNVLLEWHKELVNKLDGRADNILPSNYSIEVKTEEYWRNKNG